MINNTINGRTPEEIKKGLECCSQNTYTCGEGCPYEIECQRMGRSNDVILDTLAYIQQLERERDVAIILLRGECLACLHNDNGEPCRTKEVCQRCVYNDDTHWGMDLDYNWQWRGAPEEVK